MKDIENATDASSCRSGSIEASDFESGVLLPEKFQSNHNAPDVIAVAASEQKAVACSRLVLAGVVLLAATAMAAATYNVLENENEADFEAQFRSHANEIATVSVEKIESAIEAVESFSLTISSLAKIANMTWPFVTIPDFEARTKGLRSLTHAHTAVFVTSVNQSESFKWEQYYRENIYGWMQESVDYSGLPMSAHHMHANLDGIMPTPRASEISGNIPVAWQVAPMASPAIAFTNGNLLWDPSMGDAFLTAESIQNTSMNYYTVASAYFKSAESQLIQPIFEDVSTSTTNRKLVGAIWLGISWDTYFQNLLPADVSGIIAVLSTPCGENSTASFLINGTQGVFLDSGDLHDPKYDHLAVVSDFITFDVPEDIALPNGYCVPSLTLHLYPSDEYRATFDSNKDILYAGAVLLIFAITTIVFLIYDFMVRRRQNTVMDRVLRQHKIVSDMFPAKFHDQLYGSSDSDLNFQDSQNNASTLAELYPSVTLFFADISGFTAWSSTREPSQVFKLLETIYLAFDEIALEHGIFKVETVGDSYVAAAGVPEPRNDHAIAVCAFARDCVHKMSTLSKELEMTLGPDTGDLSMRVGIHSGQVTAGVLRGERSRFQLFGDTVNTAARMEATGQANKIQLSAITAEILKSEGKNKWIKARKDTVPVKGKGEMQTFWLLTKADQLARRKKGRSGTGKSKKVETMVPVREGSQEFGGDDDWEYEGTENFQLLGLVDRLSSKTARLVEWNVDVLSTLLKQIVAARGDTTVNIHKVSQSLLTAENQVGKGTTVLEEFQEIISLPKIGVEQLKKRVDPQTVELGDIVVSQLRDLITRIASMYRENHFHNFEHASHVTSSVRKLLSRIVKHDNSNDSAPWNLIDLSGHSYGITSDPLTQFSVVFSAVIHDADHPGVSNAQLVKEKVPLAQKFKDKSVAEQNSVALVWDLLMEDKYRELRSCIYTNGVELHRFRQLVVNTVMATDICDKELGALRKARWNKAFANEALDKLAVTPQDDTNRKATIVIEHLIQASDVSHTMQHWAVYRKWNERFFMECYAAYKAGRADSDPSVGWYQGEIGFFDFYVIPLAKKLESCGVFGVSSHEYLSYAISNRDEWVREGQAIVQSYLEAVEEIDSRRTSDTESLHDESELPDNLSLSLASQRSQRSDTSQFSC